MAEVVAVCISTRKGVRKIAVPEITIQLDHGIVGDAHAGNWHRQISLLAEESIDKMRQMGLNLTAGAFAENIVTRGIDLKTLPIGTHLRVGDCVLEVTQIGKQCHNDCAIKQATGTCVMPTEGIFAIVTDPGVIRPGDRVTRLEEPR